MEEYHKIQHYFQNNPSFNILLDLSEEDVGDLVKEVFSLKEVVFYEGFTDVIEEPNFNRRIQEVFFEYSWSEQHKKKQVTMMELIVYWMKRDLSVKVKYKEYDDIVQEARGWLKELYDAAINVKILHERKSQIKSEAEYYNNYQQQHLANSAVFPTVEFDEVPQPIIRKQLSQFYAEPIEPIVTSVATKNPLQSSNHHIDSSLIKRRLKWLFSEYNRKHHKPNNKLTFDQIPTHLSMMNLTVWMIFNKDFGFMKYLRKDDIHGLFKKCSDKQMMSFEMFEVAILEVFRRSCKTREEGWRILMVDCEENYEMKMKEMGVPLLNGKNGEDLYTANTIASIMNQRSSLLERKEMPVKAVLHKMPNTLKLLQSPSKLVKNISKVQYNLQSPIAYQTEDDDKLFLQQYKTISRKSKPPTNPPKPTPSQKFPSSSSSGLLKRLDQRIKKYINL